MILDPRNPQNAPLIDAFRALTARVNPDGWACKSEWLAGAFDGAIGRE
jgi:hypothetical protein